MKLNETFLFNCIRKYNRASRQTQKDAILHAVAVHADLIKGKKRLPVTLNPEERQITVNFLNQFLADQGVDVRIRQPSV